MQAGAILLVGGLSVRMGRAKAGLDWHGEPLVARVARVLTRAVGGGQVVVVGAPGQELPPLPGGVELVADLSEGDGPLRGLAAGLTALQGRADVAFASSVDAPFLHARFVDAVLGAVGASDDAVVPVAGGHRHPLAAAYRTSLLPVVDDLLANGERRVGVLVDRVRTRFVDEACLLAAGGLAEADPELTALHNVNTPDEYGEACAVGPPLVKVERPAGGRGEVRAWRLGEAVAGAGFTLDGGIAAAVNGEQIVDDPWYPLAAGDQVSLRLVAAGVSHG